MNERLSEELEALRAILMEDVSVQTDDCGGAEVETIILPSTADDRSSQYVRVTLYAKLKPGYPEDLPPDVKIRNPRGLDESVIKTMESEIERIIVDYTGEPVLFELIDFARDFITQQNFPSAPCVICLYGFNRDDEFIRTECYHYFHSHCLWRHMRASECQHLIEQEELPEWERTDSFQSQCPICREVLARIDFDSLCVAEPPIERENAGTFKMDDQLKDLQQKMAALFRHQQSRGGIIDPEADESKLLVTEPPEVAGPSDQPRQNTQLLEANLPRGGGAQRGRGHRGAFAAARKNRGHTFT